MGINTVRLYTCHHQIVGTGSGFWVLHENTAIGGGGGDIGKKINHGGGDVDGDEDDYFDDFDDGNEGDGGGLFRRQKFLEELFGHKFVDAVLNEWQRTMMDLPAGLEKAYDMRVETLGIVEFPILGRISKLAISWDSLIRF